MMTNVNYKIILLLYEFFLYTIIIILYLNKQYKMTY